MADVYVANPTLANREFHYRVVESMAIRRLIIPPKAQAKLPESYDGAALEYVIEQLERAGAVPANDPKAVALPHPMAYRVDRKPMSSDQIDEFVERDVAATQELAAQRTEEAGLAALAIGGKAMPEAVRSSSLEVTQMADTPGGADEAAKGGVDVEIRVDRTAGRKQTGRRRG